MLRSVVHVHKNRNSGERAGAGNKEQIKPRDCSACCSAVRHKITNDLLSFHLVQGLDKILNLRTDSIQFTSVKFELNFSSKPTTMTVSGIYSITIQRNSTQSHRCCGKKKNYCVNNCAYLFSHMQNILYIFFKSNA